MKKLSVLFLTGVACLAQTKSFQLRVEANRVSPQPVGTVIGIFATAMPPGPPGPPNGPPGPPPGPPPGGPPRGPGAEPPPMFAYRYSVSVDGGPYRIVRDFSQDGSFFWSPALQEQHATVRVTARNNKTKDTAEKDLSFEITSRTQDGKAHVTPTSNPLVALFSAPACPAGSSFQVRFGRSGEEATGSTPVMRCSGSHSENIYIAGMRADSEYELRMSTMGEGGAPTSSAPLTFHTGIPDGRFPATRVVTPPSSAASRAEPFTLMSLIEPWRIAAMDLEGNVVWYSQQPVFLTRMIGGGRFLGAVTAPNAANSMQRWQVLREFDLLGNSVRETNISRVAEQLESRGIHSDCKEGAQECVSGFHHEAIRLPNGHTLVVAGLERMFPAGTQGSKEPVDILGDLIIDLDEDFQVTWAWNSFDHFDLKRKGLSDEKCEQGAGDDGCTPVFLAKTANGWLHSNSLNYIPGEGNFLVSMPEQDWVLKINFQDGKGDGKVLWRLGNDGDFKAQSSDPHPWFSYQHDAGFEPPGSNMFSVFDDGHARKKADPKANNRNQVWKIDEATKTAMLLVNADIGVYSFAVGSAQILKNGNVSGDAGLIPGPALASRTVETAPDGRIVYALETSALVYRSFRIPDLYTCPNK